MNLVFIALYPDSPACEKLALTEKEHTVRTRSYTAAIYSSGVECHTFLLAEQFLCSLATFFVLIFK